MKLLTLAAALLLCAGFASADTVTPTWDITASGSFSGTKSDGQPGAAENFTMNLKLTFLDLSGSFFPLYSGTAHFTGILGDFTAHWLNVEPSPADGGYLATVDSYGDEIDFNVSYYEYLGGIFGNNTPFNPPQLGVTSPYLYSCNVPSICAAYGTTTGFGLFAGGGPVTWHATEAQATPEPATLLLLAASLPCILSMRKRRTAGSW